VNARLRQLAEREGLPLKVAQNTLSRLVVEAIEREDREKNEQAMSEEGEFEPVARIDEQRKKRNARRYRLKCQECGKRFTATRRHARFDSTACRVRACRKRSAA
jgi:predicted SprT family Zn-dependent metalloprotease